MENAAGCSVRDSTYRTGIVGERYEIALRSINQTGLLAEQHEWSGRRFTRVMCGPHGT